LLVDAVGTVSVFVFLRDTNISLDIGHLMTVFTDDVEQGLSARINNKEYKWDDLF
jgi:hypothetical protein